MCSEQECDVIPENLIAIMLESETKWKAIENYIITVKKMKYEDRRKEG